MKLRHQKHGKDRRKLVRVLLHFVIIFMLIGLVSIPYFQPGPSPKLSRGGLDLTGWDRERSFSLSGDWGFYWDALLSPERLPEAMTDSTMKIPAFWVGQSDDVTDSVKGAATYRLRVSGALPGERLAVRLRNIAPAYRLYVDGELLAENGAVSKDASGFAPHYDIKLVSFVSKSDSFDMILQVADFISPVGGTRSAILFGAAETVSYQDDFIKARDFFLIGCFFIIIVFCTHTYINRRDNGMLLFAHLCLVFIVRIALESDVAIQLLLRRVTYDALIRIDTLTLYWLPCLFYLLVQNVFPVIYNKRLGTALFFTAAVLSAVVLLAPPGVLFVLIVTAQAINMIIGLYSTAKIIPAVKKAKYTDYVLGGFIVLFICGVRDILYHAGVVTGGLIDWMPFGFFITAILWTYIFILRYIRVLEEHRYALQRLKHAHRREKKAELKFLKSQIRPHFINNALNTIIAVSRYDPDQSRTLLLEFSKYLRSCYDFDDLDDTIPLENELSYVRSYLTLEKARFGDKLTVVYDIDMVSVVIPPLVLQPLVENAVVHGIRQNREGGTVRIYIKREKATVRIGVCDDGCGIELEKIGKVLNGRFQNRGVGLQNINQRLQKLYRTGLHLERRAEGGTNVFMIIPLQEGLDDESSYY